MKLYCIGIGPGGEEQMTLRAVRALEKCDCVAGYGLYLDLIENLISGKERIESGMTREVLRCKAAVEAAKTGQNGRCCILGRCGCVRHGEPAARALRARAEPRGRGYSGHHGGLLGRRVLWLAADMRLCVHQPVRPAHAVGQDRAASAQAQRLAISASCLYNPSSKKRTDHLREPAIFCWRSYRRKPSAVWCAVLAEKAKAARLQRSVSCVIHRSIC